MARKIWGAGKMKLETYSVRYDIYTSNASILAELERQIEAGNMDGVGGKKAFSAAIFLSDLKKALEGGR